MNIDIVCTAKPCDGLFFYSYEYCAYLNNAGIQARLIVITHRKFSKIDYITAITQKYTTCDNLVFDDYSPGEQNVTLVLGRSMVTLAYLDFHNYTSVQQGTLNRVFAQNLVPVYSDNHPQIYPHAIDFFRPNAIADIADTEVYPHAPGLHFEKRINFDLYKPYTDDVQFEYLFLGTNENYYARSLEIIDDYPDHGILVYNEKYLDNRFNHVYAPVDNLLGIFETYVYTKNTSDPAPRLVQECKYFGKPIECQRNTTQRDGGDIYLDRDIKTPDIEPVLEAARSFEIEN